MLFTEWNWDDAKQVWQEEAQDELFELWESGVSIAEARKILRSETVSTNTTFGCSS